jgi:hypothetical protein
LTTIFSERALAARVDALPWSAVACGLHTEALADGATCQDARGRMLRVQDRLASLDRPTNQALRRQT